jgi:putative nucleotidyltransferase with HDIG domain
MPLSVEQLVSEVELSDISSIRGVLNRIIDVVNDPQSSAFDLKDAIETDPPLAARVLKRANSAFYGIARRGAGVQDIQTAVVCIGFEAIKELALSQSVCRLFRTEEEYCGYSRVLLWEHSVATAIAGRLICRREYRMPGGQVHAAGLLHDIGIIVEDQCAREGFRQALEGFRREPDLGLYAHERRVFGFTHADLGATLAERWDFPETLRLAIGQVGLPTVDVESESAMVSATVRVASWAVQRRRIGYVESPGRRDADFFEALDRLKLTRRGMDLIMDEVSAEMEQMRNAGWF